jgi:hypothetical protein
MFNSIDLVFRHVRPYCLAAAPFLVGCDSESSANQAANASNGDGQVTDTWKDYCVATFTKDTPINDAFDEVAFTARAGEQYLLLEYGTWASEPRVEIAYMTSLGPDSYEVPVAGEPAALPFTSNCTFDSTIEYYAVFADVKVYDSATLSKEICSLKAGTALPRDMSTNAGFSASSFDFSGPQIYEVMLNSLSTLCGGAELGYVSVPQTKVLGVNTALVPIQVILKPQ